jgi:hypothetical protein
MSLLRWFRCAFRTERNQPAHRKLPRRRRFRPFLEELEYRLAPATFADNGTALNLVLNTANVNAAIVANSASYTITLTGDTWSGTNDANVTGNGTATLTVTAAGIVAFTNQINVADATAGGDSVAFNSSGANAYANNFNINLSNAAAGSISFNGSSSFIGANTLSATTTDSIVVNAGAALATSGGDVVLLAGDDITINSTAVVQASNGNIDFRTGVADNTGTGIITINGTVAANATTGTVALNVNAPNATLPAGSSIVSEGATGSITGNGLLLLNSPTGTNGVFSLSASTTNLVAIIAANTQGAVNYRNNGALSVGAVNSPNEGVTTSGITSKFGAVTLTTLTGNLTTAVASGTAITTVGNTVTLTTPGAIVSATGAGVADVAASSLAMMAGTGIGTSANPIKVNNLGDLAALNSTSGDIDVTSVAVNGLTLTGTTISGLTNIVNNAPGGNIVIATQDQAIPGQNLSLFGATVQANGGKVTLRSGDDMTVETPSHVKTSGAGTLEFDIDVDPTSVDSAPGIGDILILNSAALAGASATIVGGANSDVFDVDSLTAVPIMIIGGGITPSIPTQTVSVSVGSSSVTISGARGDIVNVDDTLSKASTFYSVATNAIQSQGKMPLSFSNIQTVNLTTSMARDIVSVVGSPGTFANVTSNLSNNVFVSSTASNKSLTLNGLTAGVTYNISGTGIGSVVVAKGGVQSNMFTVTGTGASSGVELDGNTANDNFYVAATGDGSLLSLHGSAGNDLFDIGSTGVLDNIKSKVGVIGGASGFSTLFVNDQSKRANDLNYVVSASNITRLDLSKFAIAFSQVQDVTVLGAAVLNPGAHFNTMYLTGQAAGSIVGLYGQGGSYAFSVLVSSSSGYNNVVLEGRSGANNELFVTDVSGGAVNHNAPNGDGMSGAVFTTYPSKVGARTSVVQYDNVENVFLKPNNG